ncbi:flagellar motor protein [Clostridiaceae bacterium]|nr:flagellar motor protein [Clostridiaceae bacterium]
MSRRKKGGGGEDCGSWMDTYGDMVTLLLCFFVMLYSMSSLDQQKWEIFVKSIFPNSNEDQQIAINENLLEGEFDVSGNLQMEDEIEMDELDKLWITLQEKLQQNQMADGVSMNKGEGYAFISFENHAFFAGNSSQLTTEACKVLDIFCEAIAPQADSFSQIEIMGHTAKVSSAEEYNARTDRLLSSMRAAEVAAYIQSKDIIDASKLIGISYGQYRPVDTSSTSEGIAKNRRVEFLIIDNGADIKTMNDFYNEVNGGEGNASDSDGFSSAGGSMEGSASMVPSGEAPDGAEPPAEAANPAGAAAPAEPAEAANPVPAAVPDGAAQPPAE